MNQYEKNQKNYRDGLNNQRGTFTDIHSLEYRKGVLDRQAREKAYKSAFTAPSVKPISPVISSRPAVPAHPAAALRQPYAGSASTYGQSGAGDWYEESRAYSGSSGNWFLNRMEWIGSHIFPFPQLEAMGDSMNYGEGIARFLVGCVGGVALLLSTLGNPAALPWLQSLFMWAVRLAVPHENVPFFAGLAALVTGAVIGAMLTPALGKIVLLLNKAMVLAVFLAICGVVAILAYLLVAMIAAVISSSHKGIHPAGFATGSALQAGT